MGIKSVSYESYHDIEWTLALKKNLSFDTKSSYSWDKIKSIFSIHHQKEVCQFWFSNPTFFPTNHQNLSRAKFQITNIETGNIPNFSFESPTIIEVVVRSQAKKTPFHILLYSSCEDPKSNFQRIQIWNSEFNYQRVSERSDAMFKIYTLLK